MRQYEDQESNSLGRSVRATLILLAFGLGILAFLVSIGHPEWFHLRPATGTAVALSLSSDTEDGKR